jgi:hypothetical protein
VLEPDDVCFDGFDCFPSFPMNGRALCVLVVSWSFVGARAVFPAARPFLHNPSRDYTRVASTGFVQNFT